MASLVMDEKTVIGADDEECAQWLDDRFSTFVGEAADNLALSFALGTGAWACDFDGLGIKPRVRLTYYDVGQIVPLVTDRDISVASAFVSVVANKGKRYQQLQIHDLDSETGTYHIKTHMFDMKGKELQFEEINPDLDTLQPYPTYALVSPAIANRYEDATALGVSLYANAVDALMAVDQAFDGFCQTVRFCIPRMYIDKTAVDIDPTTGKMSIAGTVDADLYRVMSGSVDKGFPVTIYNPELRLDEREGAINAALSILSSKCGFGQNYFSWTRASGLKTATEVTSDNSALFRNVRRHEMAVGKALRRLFTGAYIAECALTTGRDPEDPGVNIQWDDSVVEDSKTERELMKDDIARGLCPAYLYPMRYYGMSEEEARALTGEGAAANGIPEEE